jgi:hypothetical protein
MSERRFVMKFCVSLCVLAGVMVGCAAPAEEEVQGDTTSQITAGPTNQCTDNVGTPTAGAIPGGRDGNGSGDLLYLCIAKHTDGSSQPGKWVRNGGTCHYGFHGKEYSTTDFTWLRTQAGYTLSWLHYDQVHAASTSCPNSFVWADGIDSDGTALGSCSTLVYPSGGTPGTSAPLTTSHHPGKMRGTTCYVAYGGQEYAMGYDVSSELPVDFYVPVFYKNGDTCIPSFGGGQHICN